MIKTTSLDKPVDKFSYNNLLPLHTTDWTKILIKCNVYYWRHVDFSNFENKMNDWSFCPGLLQRLSSGDPSSVAFSSVRTTFSPKQLSGFTRVKKREKKNDTAWKISMKTFFSVRETCDSEFSSELVQKYSTFMLTWLYKFSPHAILDILPLKIYCIKETILLSFFR